MAGLIEELDYGNFKATIFDSDRFRHEAYYKCWKAMDEWQGKISKMGVPVGVLFSEIRVNRVHTVTQRAKQILGKTNTYSNNRWF